MPYKNYKHIDLSYISDLSEGDIPFISEIVTLFITKAPSELQNLSDSINKTDWLLVRSQAHKMKSSFNHIGLKELIPIIQSIEDSANSLSGLGLIPGKFETVKVVCTQAIEELKEELKQMRV